MKAGLGSPASDKKNASISGMCIFGTISEPVTVPNTRHELFRWMVQLAGRLLTVSVVNTDGDLIGCRLCSIYQRMKSSGPMGFWIPLETYRHPRASLVGVYIVSVGL